MIYRLSAVGAGLLLGSVLWLAAALPARAETALIAVAANFTAAAEQLAADYAKESGHTVTFSSGSTGQLFAQIVNGAPFDAFLSADEDRAKTLEETKGLAVAGSRFTYAEGQLVWWMPRAFLADDKGTFGVSALKRIAIANPKLAPYGRAALEVLKSRPDWADLQGRLVYGQNIAQAHAMIDTGNADGGLIARSLVQPYVDFDKGLAIAVDTVQHAPIRQDAVLLERGKDNAAATGFLAYLRSPAARETLQAFGYRRGDGN